MNRLKHFSLADIMPTQEDVLRSQGMSKGVAAPTGIQALLAEAMDLFAGICEPAGLNAELSPYEFGEIYQGEGKNEEVTPLDRIYPRAQALAVFALTLGSQISERIAGAFTDRDFALGSMLDAAASLAADKAVEIWETHFRDELVSRHPTIPDSCALSYSPGYCGWHISGQKKLFQYLRPERIGISLNDSCLMTPLKSVSGVLVAGPGEIHLFEADFHFCHPCKTHSCHQRMKRLGIT
jgi:hypothetical protein